MLGCEVTMREAVFAMVRGCVAARMIVLRRMITGVLMVILVVSMVISVVSMVALVRVRMDRKVIPDAMLMRAEGVMERHVHHRQGFEAAKPEQRGEQRPPGKLALCGLETAHRRPTIQAL